jgi:1,1a-dihydroxy-1-hydro-9-fluorenone dehydrogenase
MEASVPGNLRDRVIVITGGARGMGRAMVDALLKGGTNVVATDRSWQGADKPTSTNALVADMDVTNDAQIDAVYRAAIDKFGTIHGLVNNAAMRQRDLFPPTGRTTTLETKDTDWERAFAVNVFGALKVTRRFIKPMIEQKRGSVISIVSSGILNYSHGGGYMALRPNSQEMPYQSTKAALATMMFYLADDMKNNNVAVNSIIAGHARTTGFDEQNRARLQGGARQGPQPMVPEHIVPLAGHLLAQDASTITGRMFDVTVWNLEHGLGDHARWQDASFSYQKLMAS